MHSLWFVVIAFSALPSDGQRLQTILCRPGEVDADCSSSETSPVERSRNKDITRLVTLLLALNGPAAPRQDSRITRHAVRSTSPQLDTPTRNVGSPTSFEDYMAQRRKQEAAQQSGQQASIDTKLAAPSGGDMGLKPPTPIDRTSSLQTPIDTKPPTPIERTSSDEISSDEQVEMETKKDIRLEGKSLPELVSESLSNLAAPSFDNLPSPSLDDLPTPTVAARSARVVLPVLGIAGLAAGSVLYNEPQDVKVVTKKTVEPVKDVKEKVVETVVTQKTPPPPSIDPAAEAALNRFFPGALDSSTTEGKIAAVLSKRGFTKANTLFASSACPDEVNSEPGDLVELMKSRWGEKFDLGGLAGLPFVGKAGFTAYAHHVPDNGKLLVLFAPHVGVDYDGKVGKLRRQNQKGVSTACGAAIGAYNGIMKEALANKNGADGVATQKTSRSRNDFDGQIDYIKAKLRPRLQGIDAAPDQIAFITYQMYAIVREFLIDQVLTASEVWRDAAELCVVGGIMVNLGDNNDRFVPLFFQTKEGERSPVVDLYREAFGEKPDLSYVLGDKSKAANFYKYDLSTLSMTTGAKMLKLFPGALDSSTMDKKVANTLSKYGYTSANTLFATSTCPDEVNAKQGELVELMKSRWGENFALGGLAGLPFVGKSGFSAYAHHVPDNGKLLVMFAPHVGIDFDGKVGALKRLNQKGVSTACGAAIGAYNGIIKEALDFNFFGLGGTDSSTISQTGDAFDAQINYIKAKLKPRLKGIESAPDPIAFVTYQMYAIVREFVDDVLSGSNLFEDASEVCILGGIMVNGDTSDHFMPLLFESKKGKTADVNDLYVETFGYRPDLSYVLGDGAMATNFYKTDLRALS